MFEGSGPVTVYLDSDATVIGYDFYDVTTRTGIANRFFNIEVGEIDKRVFDFPKERVVGSESAADCSVPMISATSAVASFHVRIVLPILHRLGGFEIFSRVSIVLLLYLSQTVCWELNNVQREAMNSAHFRHPKIWSISARI